VSRRWLAHTAHIQALALGLQEASAAMVLQYM
jgi:hypothetical protein